MDRAAFVPSLLSGVELEIREISSNPVWESKYAMSVPVLAAIDPDGSNEVCFFIIPSFWYYLDTKIFFLFISCRERCPVPHPD